MRKIYIIALVIIVLSFLVSAYVYPGLPDQIATHWNEKGEVNGYMGKFWGLFLLPVITLAMFLFFILIPKIDPLKSNYEKFQKTFDGFILAITLFLFYLHLMTIAWNLGYAYNMMRWLAPAMSALIYFSGVLIAKAERNWFVGIRTPWTISNDQVWADTHRIGGKLFKAVAMLSLIGMIWPDLYIWFLLIPLILASIYLVIYSYIDFKKLEKSGKIK